MHDFYPEIEPFNYFMLDVGEGHQLYVEQCGNPLGQPVLFIHGGPGGGCSTNDRRFFDPECYRIILFDQRGCGRSTPHGSLENNTTDDLVSDIEKIRQHLSLDKWHIFGGSWGSTLGLVYAQTHPQHVISMVLRGIFLSREQDINWVFSQSGGATRIFPDYWHEFETVLNEHNVKPNINAIYDVFKGPHENEQDKQKALALAKAWAMWEIRSCTLEPDEEFLSHFEDDASSWTLARHECHYMVNACFLSDGQILNNCDKIKDIPCTIVHGRYDIVCAIDNAWELHKHLPLSSFVVSKTAGHASCETETKHHLVTATKKMLEHG